MIDMRHPLAVLATRMPWQEIEAALAPVLAHKGRAGRNIEGADLFGPTLAVAGAGVSNAGRPRLPIRLMVSLLYLKHAYNESDESVREGGFLRCRAPSPCGPAPCSAVRLRLAARPPSAASRRNRHLARPLSVRGGCPQKSGYLTSPPQITQRWPGSASRGCPRTNYSHLSNGGVVCVLEDWYPPFSGFHLYYPNRHRHSAWSWMHGPL